MTEGGWAVAAKGRKERGEEGENNGHPSSLGKLSQQRWRDLLGRRMVSEKREKASLSREAETLKKRNYPFD